MTVMLTLAIGAGNVRAEAKPEAASPAPPAPNSSAASGVPEAVARIVAEMTSASAPITTHKEHRLRFKKDPDDDKKKPQPKLPEWLLRLVSWLADAGNGLVWLLGAVAVALLIVFAWRWARVRSDVRRPRQLDLPSHVNDLDIRPESLPADVAAAALALCRQGERRAALSLLYRGALSRLVHGHGAPILASSTEGECARIAAQVLPDAAAAYFARLVTGWQLEVYAGRAAEAGAIEALCDGFEAHFREPVQTPTDGAVDAGSDATRALVRSAESAA